MVRIHVGAQLFRAYFATPFEASKLDVGNKRKTAFRFRYLAAVEMLVTLA